MSKRKKRKQGEVELNLAAMLDMAFQLLTFFILTFRPAPVEGDVLLHMPPAMPTTMLKNAQASGASEKNVNPVQGLDTLLITVIGDRSGITDLVVGTANARGLPEFESRLQQVLTDKGVAFQQVLVQISPNVYYEDVMRVVDICTRQKFADGKSLQRLSFVEMKTN